MPKKLLFIDRSIQILNNNFLGIRGLYKTHMDRLKPFYSKSMTHTYFGYSEQNHRKTTDLCESQIFGPTLSHVVFFNTLGFMYFVVFLDVYGWPLWNVS